MKVFFANSGSPRAEGLHKHRRKNLAPAVPFGLPNQLCLSAFTTQTNQTPEGNAIVDIGYHYWAFATFVPTNVVCVSAPVCQLTSGTQSFCIGEPACDVATWTDQAGLVAEFGLDTNGNWAAVTNLVYSTILTNWNVLEWNGVQVTNWGSGITPMSSFTTNWCVVNSNGATVTNWASGTAWGYSFTPTNTGVGTNVFYFTYSNATPCDPGPFTISITNIFAVLAVGSLAPGDFDDFTPWIEISNNLPNTRTFLVQADTNYGQTIFHVQAVPTPSLGSGPLPDCWQITHEEGPLHAILNISTTAVYEVDCVCGTSALTNFIVVMTNDVTSYTNGIDTNDIVFAISVTNQFVASSTVGVNIVLVSGNPTNIAVLVDSTNFSSATWTPYISSNITVNLGSAQGLHNISVGLEGAPPFSQQAWNTTTVFLDSTSPTIAITNPANNATFNASRLNVSGNFSGPSVQQITVNGVLAFINRTNFEAINVPLSAGANLITASLACSTSLTNAASITVITTTNADGGLNNPVQLQAAPTAGFNPLAVVFQPQTNIPGVTQVFYDFVGNDIPGLATNNLNSVAYTYTTNGQYYPVVTVQTAVGRFSSVGGWNTIFADLSNEPIRITVEPQPVSGSATVTNINGLAALINITDPVALKWTATSNIYVLSGSTATITEFDTNGNIVRALSGIGSNPTGLDVDAAGNVYVAMNGANQVWRFNPTASSFVADTTFGTNGNGYIGGAGTNAGQFNAPFGVAVAADNSVISVTDSGNNRVQQFDTSGNFVNLFGGLGRDLGQFNSPAGITYDYRNYWYVVDSGNDRVVQGRDFYATAIGGMSGGALGQFNGPLNLSVGMRGVYVADTGNSRSQGFDFSTDGETDGFDLGPNTVRFAVSSGLNQPAAVAVVNNFTNDMFYIADTANNRVILYAVGAENPAGVWSNMIVRLQAGDISGAISFFSDAAAPDYQHDFLAIGLPALLPAMNAIGPLTPVYICGDTAQYYFIRNIQGISVTFPVDFDEERGVWKINCF